MYVWIVQIHHSNSCFCVNLGKQWAVSQVLLCHHDGVGMCLYTYRIYIILMCTHFSWLQSMKIEVHLPLMVTWFLLENCGMHHSGMKVRWLQCTFVEWKIYSSGLSYPVSLWDSSCSHASSGVLAFSSLVFTGMALLHKVCRIVFQVQIRVAKHLLPFFVPLTNMNVGHAKKMWCSPLQLCSMHKIPCLHDCKLTRI